MFTAEKGLLTFPQNVVKVCVKLGGKSKEGKIWREKVELFFLETFL